MGSKSAQHTSAKQLQTDVVFYVLNSTEPAAREQFLNKLLAKIWSEVRQADVRFTDIKSAQRYDLKLWDKDPQSFIPHSVARLVEAPIQLFGENISAPSKDVLINLHPEFPQQFLLYQRTIEVLDQSDYLIKMGRERWKSYKQQGFEPIVHKIGFNNSAQN